MAICPACRGAKVIPLMGHMSTKKCISCLGKGTASKLEPAAVKLDSTKSDEDTKSEINVINGMHDQIVSEELEDSPKQDAKKSAKTKSKSKWSL